MRSVYIEVIESCNLNCVFCSRGDKQGSHPTKKLKKLLKKYKGDGYKKAILTGGEPLLNEDLEELIAYAFSIGFDVAIQTNGTLLTEEKARTFKKAGLDQMIFSIHSHIHKMEDELMNGKGVLEKQIEGLKMAHDAGLFTPVTTLILKQNYKILPKFFEFMINEHPYVHHFTLNFVDPIGRSEKNASVVPKFNDIEPHLARALLILKKANKTFRVERVPICYMLEFAEYSTELRRMWTKEPAAVHRDKESISYTDKYFEVEYVRGDACKACWINHICPGIDIHYAEIYGTGELYPVFIEPEKILRDAGED